MMYAMLCGYPAPAGCTLHVLGNCTVSLAEMWLQASFADGVTGIEHELAVYGCLVSAETWAPVGLDEFLREAIIEGFKQVRSHARACAACNAVAQHKALKAVAVACLPVCTTDSG